MFQWVGALAGAGWTIGALKVAFEIIVPFTALSWIWMITLGAVMWVRAGTLAKQPEQESG